MHRDLRHNVEVKAALNIAAFASDADVNGIIIDTQGFESGMVVLRTGAVTDGDIVVKEIQESDASDMAGEEAIPAARLLDDFVALDGANGMTKVGFVCTKRYIRVVFTTDNSADLTAGALCLLGHPHKAL